MIKSKKKLCAYLALMFISGCSGITAISYVGLDLIYPSRKEALSCETERQILIHNETLEKTHK